MKVGVIASALGLLLPVAQATSQTSDLSASPPDQPTASAPAATTASVDAPAPEDGTSVVGSVQVGSTPFFHGSGVFGLGGALGGILASGAYKDEPARIAAYARQENIDIAAIVKGEFERQFGQSAKAQARFRKDGATPLDMAILYGITSVPFGDYRPYLSVRMHRKDANGAETWTDREYVGGQGDAKAIPYTDFYKSPAIFADEFQQAAKEVVALLVRNFSR